MDDFRSALKDQEELIEMIGNPYTCCFQWSVMSIMELANNHGKGERIKFIHEVNDFQGEAQKTFDYLRQSPGPKGTKMSLAFGTKAENPPLQAVDILAYEGGKFLKDPAGTPRRAWTALDPDNTRIIAHSHGKEQMPALIADLRTFREKSLAGPAGRGISFFGQA
jgi:hypothetical protein